MPSVITGRVVGALGHSPESVRFTGLPTSSASGAPRRTPLCGVVLLSTCEQASQANRADSLCHQVHKSAKSKPSRQRRQQKQTSQHSAQADTNQQPKAPKAKLHSPAFSRSAKPHLTATSPISTFSPRQQRPFWQPSLIAMSSCSPTEVSHSQFLHPPTRHL